MVDVANMQEQDSATPTKITGKLDALPKEELIKYIKKQAAQMKDLKKKNEDLNLILNHDKKEMEKLEQEQKAWLSRGVSAEFEKKEELEKKERELQMAAHLGQQMLAENDTLRNRCNELEQENNTMREEMSIELRRIDAEKETIEQTLTMIQTEYKEAKVEVNKLREALEMAAAEHDKEHEKWEEERKEFRATIMELENHSSLANLSEAKDSSMEINKELQEKVDELQKQIESFGKEESEGSERILAENQGLKAKLEADNVEMKAQDESLKVLRKNCEELQAKNEELHQFVNMLSLERDESNTYSKQLDEEVKKIKEEREKLVRSLKAAKGKLEKSSAFEEELKTHLNLLTTEKGELQLMVKNLQREKKSLMIANKKLKEKMRTSANRKPSLDEVTGDQSLEKENEELKKEVNFLKMKFENDGDAGSLKNENKELIEKNIAAEKELELLRGKLLEIEKDLAKQKFENEDDKASVLKLQARVDELLSTLQSLNEEKMHQEAEIEELFKTHDELQIKYDNECRERIGCEQKIQEFEEELSKQKIGVAELTQELSALQRKAPSEEATNNMYTQTDSVDECEEEEEEVKSKELVIMLKAELEEKRLKVEDLNQQLRCVEEELEVERQEMKILQSNFHEKMSSVEEFEETEKQIASINEESREEMAKLRAELEELRRNLNDREGNEEDHALKEEMFQMKKMLNEKDDVIKKSECCKEELQRRMDQLSKDHEDQKEIITDLRMTLSEKDDVIEKSECCKEELQRRIDQLSKDHEDQKEIITDLRMILSEKDDVIKKSECCKEELQRRMDQLSKDHEDQKEIITDLRMILSQKDDVIEKSECCKEELQRRIDQLSKDHEDQKEIITDLKKKIWALDEQVEKLGDEKAKEMKNVELLNSVVEERDRENNEMKSRIKDYECKEASLNDQMLEIKNKTANEDHKSNEADKYKKGYKKIKEKFNEVGAINEKLKCELQTKCIEVEELKKELLSQELSLKDLQETIAKEVESRNYQANDVLTTVEEKDKMISDLEMELRQSRDDSKGMLIENAALKDEIVKLTVIVAEVDQLKLNEQKHEICLEKKNGLEKQVKQLLQENGDIKCKLEDQIENSRELRSAFERIAKEKEDLSQILKDNRSRLNELLVEKEEFVGCMKDLEGLKVSLKEEEEKSKLLKVENAELSNGRKEDQLIIQDLNEEKKESERKFSDLMNEAEIMKKIRAEQDQAFRNKKEEMLKIKERLNDFEEKLKVSTNDIEEKRNSIEKKNEKILELENALQNLEENLRENLLELEKERRRFSEVLKEKDEISIKLCDAGEKMSLLEASKIEIEKIAVSRNSEITNHSERLENEIKLLKEEKNDIVEMKKRLEILQNDCAEKDAKIKEFSDIIKEDKNRLELISKELMEAKAECEEAAIYSEGKKIKDVMEELRTFRQTIDSLEESNKEKTEKMNKFKSVAIKAKKEIDSVKEKSSNEKQELEETIQVLNKEIQKYNEDSEKQSQDFSHFREKYKGLKIEFDTATSKAEQESERNIEAQDRIKNLTAVIDNLQFSLASIENQNANLEISLKEKQVDFDDLVLQLNQAKNEKAELSQFLSEEKNEHENTKVELARLTAEFEIAKKDVHQMKMISLEMDDYHRTLQSLQNKLSDRENERQESNERTQELEQKITKLDEKIASLNEKNNLASQEIDNLTSQLFQKNVDLENLMTEKEKLEKREHSLKQQIEDTSRLCEERMIQISDLASEKEKILQQLKKEKSTHEKNLQTTELKLSRASTELGLLQEAYENCKQEFESYKIRAQNVLKQQKMKKTENGESQFVQEKSRLEDIIGQLKEKLTETNESLKATAADNEEIELEHEKLKKLHEKLVQEISEKELQWRNRFTEIQTEMKKQAADSKDEIQNLSQQNDELHAKLKSTEEYEAVVQDYEDTIKDLKEQIKNVRQSPKRQNSRGKKIVATDGDVKEHRGTPENLKLLTENNSDGVHGFVERPGAEGMDSSELEAIDKSLPATPVSTDSANILDKILSPTEPQAPVSWPTSPTASKEEGLKLRSALTLAEKNVEHLSVLLAETEGSNVRLSEQIKVLKTEIRRMQQNQEREEALHNLEYLKNVIIKFMKCGTTERECMVPVLTTMLKLTPEEKRFISEFAKGDADQGEDSAGWSSYVYRWTSFS